jgi:hypothetical protein
MTAARLDATLAAAVLSANGSDVPPDVSDAAGYNAYRFATRDEAERWAELLTASPRHTLIGLCNVEGGWLYLYDMQANIRVPEQRRHR